MLESTARAAGRAAQPQVARRARIAAMLLALPAGAAAGFCEHAWDGRHTALSVAGRYGGELMELENARGTTQVTVDQLWAFFEAKRRISRATGFYPELVVCGDDEPNAFAVKRQDGGSVIGVTAGMLRLLDGDVGMAAAVVGHEFAHHSLGHNEQSESRDSLIGFAALLAAIIVQAKSGGQVSPHQAAEGAKAGARLLSRKFDRDQERAADETGLKHMIAAGFDPRRALALAEELRALGKGGGGFFDTHPGWEERAERLRALIPADAPAREAETKNEPSDADRRYADAQGALRTGDTPSALREFAALADAGHAPAQYVMGYFHRYGRGGLPKDDEAAARFFRLAAEQAHPAAQNALGSMYVAGAGGLPKDYAEAVRLFRLAAERGDANGQANYGYAHIRGLGGAERDEVEAVTWLRRAIQQDSAFARTQLGILYTKGVEIRRNYPEAVRLWSLAAETGYPLAQAHLGEMYLRGLGGLERNDAEALRLTRLAAEQGNPVGQYNLARMFHMGWAGLPQDVEQAIYWYEKAGARDMVRILRPKPPAEDAGR